MYTNCILKRMCCTFFLFILILQVHAQKTTTTAEDMFVQSILSKSSVYENESFLMTTRLYTNSDIVGVNHKSFHFDGFLAKEIHISSRQFEMANYQGKNYRTVILRQYQLFPLYQDTLIINANQFEFEYTTRFSPINTFKTLWNGQRDYEEKSKKVTSNTLSIFVKPFPPNAPPSFRGGVGNFTMSTSIDTTSAYPGDSVKITLQISGTGSLELLPAPDLIVPDGFLVTQNQTAKQIKVTTEHVSGSKTIVYTLISGKAGSFDVKVPGLVYLNPHTHTYQHTEDILFSLDVRPNPYATGDESKSEQVQLTEVEDISDNGSVDPGRSNPGRFMVYIGVVLLILLCAFYIYVYCQKKMSHTNFIMRIVVFAGGLVFAWWFLSRPVAGNNEKDAVVEKGKEKRIDIMYAVDVSTSMQAEDFTPNRLQAVKTLLQADSRYQEKFCVGLMGFAAEIGLVCPLTDNLNHFSASVQRIDSLNLSDGTAIGTGILGAIKSLTQHEYGHQNLVLFTDGSNNSGDISLRDAAEIAAIHHIRLYIVALAHPEEANISYSVQPIKKYKKIPTDIDSTLCTTLSHIAGGEFYRIHNDLELQDVLTRIHTHIKEHTDNPYPVYDGKLTKEKAGQLLNNVSF